MRLDAERLALLNGGVATILGKSWTTLPNTSVMPVITCRLLQFGISRRFAALLNLKD